MSRLEYTFVLGFLLSGLYAQQLPIRTYTASDGLPHNIIEHIVRDSHGFLWFCTRGGLSQFDGYQFTNYGTADGLASARVETLLETRAGDYWVGTFAGLYHFDPKSKGSARFTVYRPEDPRAWWVRAIFEDRAGNLWIGTQNGLYQFKPSAFGRNSAQGREALSGWRFVDIGPSPDHPNVNAIAEDHDGALWVATDLGLFRLQPDGRIDQYWSDDRITGRAGVLSLMVDPQGTLWVGTWGGLWKVPPGSDPDLAQLVPGSGNGTLNQVWSLLQAGDGHLWAGIDFRDSDPGNLCLIDERAARVIQCYSRSNGIRWKVFALAEDREGNLWLGTGGFGALRKARQGFVTFRLEGSTDILETQAGELCVGKRVEVSLLKDGRFTEIRPKFSGTITWLGWGTRQTILQDRSGDWWFPTGQGLFRFGPSTSVKSLAGLAPKAIYTQRDGLASDEVFRLFEDRESNIWVASISGVSRWERATGKWRHYFRDPGLPNPLREMVGSFGEDHFGAVWFGFWDGYLARFHDGAFQFFTQSDGWVQPRASGIGGAVRAIHEDSQGALWIGSSRGLTCVLSPGAPHPRFLHFSVADGLSSNDVTSVISDNSGRIYTANGHGVDQIDVLRAGNSVQLGRIRHYTTADGLSPGTTGMAFRDRAGTLWFQSDSGLSQLQPDDAPLHPSAVRIRTLRIAGLAFPLSDLGESTVSIPRLKPGQNDVEIGYSGLTFAPGETLRYQYILEGADKGWSEPTLERSVNYANLAAGNYRFLVRNADSDSSDGALAASVVFTIDPPVWRRGWFLALLAAAILSAGAALYRLRVGQLLELERVRTRIATDLHDDIGSNLSQMAILSEVALQNDGGPNHNALARIAEVSRETVHSISDIVWAVDPQHDRLSDLTNRMRRFANDVLGARNIKLCFLSSGEREIRIPPDVRREIFLIFKECVNNAARHSGCDAVDVGFTVENSWLELRLADNGRGLDASVAPSGHGLTSMRRRVHGLGGEIEVASRELGGVSVHLRVPLPKESYMFK